MLCGEIIIKKVPHAMQKIPENQKIYIPRDTVIGAYHKSKSLYYSSDQLWQVRPGIPHIQKADSGKNKSMIYTLVCGVK